MYIALLLVLLQTLDSSAQLQGPGSGLQDCVVIEQVIRLSNSSVGLVWNTTGNYEPQAAETYIIEYYGNRTSSLQFSHNSSIMVVASNGTSRYAYCIANLLDLDYYFQVLPPQLGCSSSNVYALNFQGQNFSYMPFEFNAEAQSATTVHFTWQSTERVVFSCKTLDNFLVQLPSQIGFSLQFHSNVTNYTIEAFSPATPYLCSISAVSSEGTTGPNNTLSFITSPDNIQLNATNTSVVVSWDPTDSANITGYTVYFNTTNTSQSQDVHITDSPSAILTGLMPYTEVIVEVSANTMAENGERSAPAIIRTSEGIPGPVLNLQAGPLSSSSLAVAWEEPTVTNGRVTYLYTLNSTLEDHMQLSTNHTVVHIGNLTLNTEYSVSVRASTTAGQGTETKLTGLYTYESVPGTVQISTINRTTGRAVSIHWNTVQTQNTGRETGYRITISPLYTCNTLPMEYTTNTTWYDIGSLDPTVTYTVQVAAFNPTGEGPCDERNLVPELTAFDASTQTNFIRLRLTAVEGCSMWNAQTGTDEIKIELERRLDLLLPSSHEREFENCFQDANVTCPENGQNYLNFQTAITATCPASSLHQTLNFWVSLTSPFLIVNGFILTLDKTCPVLYIESLDANDSCTTLVTPCMNATVTLSNSGASGAIAGAVIGGLAVGAIAVALVVLGVFLFLKKRDRSQKQKKQPEDDEGVKPVKYKHPPSSDTKTQIHKAEHQYDYIDVTNYKVAPQNTNQPSKAVKSATAPNPKTKSSVNELSSAYEDDGGYELPDIAMQSYQNKQQQQKQGDAIEIFYDNPEISSSGTEPASLKKANPALMKSQSRRARAANQPNSGQTKKAQPQYCNTQAAHSAKKQPQKTTENISSNSPKPYSQPVATKSAATAPKSSLQPKTVSKPTKAKTQNASNVAAKPHTQQSTSAAQGPTDTSSLSFAEKLSLASKTQKPAAQPPVKTVTPAASAMDESVPTKSKAHMKAQRSASHSRSSLAAAKIESEGSQASRKYQQQTLEPVSTPHTLQLQAQYTTPTEASQATKKAPLLPKHVTSKTPLTPPQPKSVPLFPPLTAAKPKSKQPKQIATGGEAAAAFLSSTSSSGGEAPAQPTKTRPKPLKGSGGNIGLQRNLAYEPMSKKSENLYTFGGN